ncbi:MAG: endolytic transglycosylase MltG [Propionibacteriaceae bacterium]|jgi:UPF0755 protein|nr:endolytic transglycosylase MltG [Propionibacteriaceae bacterium]
MRSGSPTPAQRVKSAIAVLISLAVLGGGGVFVGLKAYDWYSEYSQRDDYVGDGRDDIVITIPSGANWLRAADILESNNVIADADTFLDVVNKADAAAKARAKAAGEDESQAGLTLQKGSFNMKTHLPCQTALDRLLDPKYKIILEATLTEGLRWSEIRALLVENSDLTEDDFNLAVQDTAQLGLPDYAQGQFEGYLFPDTYQLPDGNEEGLAREIIQKMVARFKEQAEALDLEAQAAAIGRSPRDIVIVASIIEKEVNAEADRAKAARAIYNRLDQGIPLGVESAFRYGRLMADGTPYGDEITIESQQNSDLPYNVYRNPGLPSSAISNPGWAALEAALHPAEGDWLYWVTVNLETGETVFTADESEFAAAAEQFHQWCAEHDNPVGCV